MRKPLLLLVPAVLLLGYSTLSVPCTYAQAPSPERIKKIYQVDCALCHGDNGDGKTDLGKAMGVTSNFTDPKSLAPMSDQQIIDLIRKGKDKMPGEDDMRAKDHEMKALVQHLRNFSKGTPASVPVAAPVAAPADAPAAAPPAPTGK